jgi:CubicO group peptidase (beta-lactamase class C family)
MPLFGALLSLLAPPLLAEATHSAAQLDAAVVKQIDGVFAEWDNTRSPGCVVGVSRGGRVVFARGYGMSNLEYDVPNTPGSIFHIASISKQFTAAAVALLAADGKLSWSDDIRRYLPELPDYGHTITLAHLAHHTSGLRDQWSLLRMAGWREDDVITEADVLAIAARQRALNFAPGEEFLYCNTGFTLLAVVVKRVSGQSLRDFAAERIFNPLGMHATHFHNDHTELVRGRTFAYQPRPGGRWAISIPVFDTDGATSLFTTVGDLLKWEQNFAEPRIGGRAFVEAMVVSGQLNNGTATGYSLGLVTEKPRGVVEVGHNGADAGYRSDVVRFPEHDLAIAVFCNLGTMRPSMLARKVAEIVLGPGVFEPLPPAVAMSEQELKALEGAYWNELTDDVRRFSIKDSKLVAEGRSDALVPIGGGRFRVGESSAQIEFPVVATGGVQELHVLSPPLPVAKFKHVVSPTLSQEELVGFVGAFFSAELENTFRVATTADGKLEVRWRRDGSMPLQPLKRDTFTLLNVATITFTRGSAGEVTGMTISAGRVRRLALTKMGPGQ